MVLSVTMHWLLVIGNLTPVAFPIGVRFSQISRPGVSICWCWFSCSAVPLGIQAFSPPFSIAHWNFVLILVNHVHKWPLQGPGIRRQRAQPNSPSPPPDGLQRSNLSLLPLCYHPQIHFPCESQDDIFNSTVTCYFLHYSKHSYVPSRCRVKSKLLSKLFARF